VASGTILAASAFPSRGLLERLGIVRVCHAMPDVQVVDYGFFKETRYNDEGLPVGGSQFAGGILPPNIREAILYFRLAGSSGDYQLSIHVQSYTDQPDSSISFDPQTITIRPNSHCHITIPIEIEPLPMGEYQLMIYVDDVRLATAKFAVGHGSSRSN